MKHSPPSPHIHTEKVANCSSPSLLLVFQTKKYPHVREFYKSTKEHYHDNPSGREPTKASTSGMNYPGSPYLASLKVQTKVAATDSTLSRTGLGQLDGEWTRWQVADVFCDMHEASSPTAPPSLPCCGGARPPALARTRASLQSPVSSIKIALNRALRPRAGRDNKVTMHTSTRSATRAQKGFFTWSGRLPANYEGNGEWGSTTKF